MMKLTRDSRVERCFHEIIIPSTLLAARLGLKDAQVKGKQREWNINNPPDWQYYNFLFYVLNNVQYGSRRVNWHFA